MLVASLCILHWNAISGYQIRSRHALLKMLTGTKEKEDLSFDNINTLLITSTSLIVLSCVMEVCIYFLYNNKVQKTTQIRLHLEPDFAVPSQNRDCVRARGGKQEINR